MYLEGRVEIVCDDITSLDVDSIVNAAAFARLITIREFFADDRL